MEIQNISGSDAVSSNFTVKNPVHENTAAESEPKEIQRNEIQTDKEKGQAIDTYA